MLERLPYRNHRVPPPSTPIRLRGIGGQPIRLTFSEGRITLISRPDLVYQPVYAAVRFENDSPVEWTYYTMSMRDARLERDIRANLPAVSRVRIAPDWLSIQYRHPIHLSHSANIWSARTDRPPTGGTVNPGPTRGVVEIFFTITEVPQPRGAMHASPAVLSSIR